MEIVNICLLHITTSDKKGSVKKPPTKKTAILQEKQDSSLLTAYTFCEVIDHIDLNKYLTTEDRRTDRPRYDEETLLKVILFAFMEKGYESLRKIGKLCKTDSRHRIRKLQQLPLLRRTRYEKIYEIYHVRKGKQGPKYRDDPYRAVKFPVDAEGDPICLNGKKFHYLYSRPVKENKYGRTEEFYQCEDCSNCLQKEKCCKCKGNRIVRLNEELTKFHEKVLCNLNSVHGALLRINRSIQSE